MATARQFGTTPTTRELVDRLMAVVAEQGEAITVLVRRLEALEHKVDGAEGEDARSPLFHLEMRDFIGFSAGLLIQTPGKAPRSGSESYRALPQGKSISERRLIVRPCPAKPVGGYGLADGTRYPPVGAPKRSSLPIIGALAKTCRPRGLSAVV
jgi:hypothetical protein